MAELSKADGKSEYYELLALLASDGDDQGAQPSSAEDTEGDDGFENAFFSGIDLEEEAADHRPLEAPVNASDFGDPRLQFVFERTKENIRTACKVNTKPGPRKNALRWIFVPGSPDKYSLEFELCCTAMGARPLVLRARTQYQLWKAGIVLPEPLDLLSVSLPHAFTSAIMTIIGLGACVGLADMIWSWPGISGVFLRKRSQDILGLDEQGYRMALRELMANGFVASGHACLYFIARNPDLMTAAQLRRFSFSRSIHGDT